MTAVSTRDLIAESRKRFVQDTAEHKMTVLLDNDLYRHLRFQKPGTSMYYFDLITWPGYLTITGDCGTFVFSRTRDMMEFFVDPDRRYGRFKDERMGINPHYWSEKLQAPKPDGAERYSEQQFKQHVMEWYEEAAKDLPDEAQALREALSDQVLSRDASNEYEAHGLLNDFEFSGRRIYDSWEWSLRDWDWQFLWCCWAIVWGINEYRTLVP